MVKSDNRRNILQLVQETLEFIEPLNSFFSKGINPLQILKLISLFIFISSIFIVHRDCKLIFYFVLMFFILFKILGKTWSFLKVRISLYKSFKNLKLQFHYLVMISFNKSVSIHFKITENANQVLGKSILGGGMGGGGSILLISTWSRIF